MHRLIGHAVSRDWLHWEEWPFIELTGAAGAWDSGRIGTGWTWRHRDGRYYMAYTGRIDPREDIGLAVSDDLITWSKVSDRPVWPQANQTPYEPRGSVDELPPAWRDPFVVEHEDGTYAYACARSRHGAPSARGCVARCRIDDLRSWETLAPTAADTGYAIMEVPELFAFDGMWWLTFNTHSGWGRRLDTSSRRLAGGTFFLCSDAPDGPWLHPADNLLIGSGEGRRDAVVARSVLFGGERLVYHHYTGPIAPDSPRALGLPKILRRSGDAIELGPWSGLSRIWRDPVAAGNWEAMTGSIWCPGRWTGDRERVTVGSTEGIAGCARRLGVLDVDLEADIRIRGKGRAGLCPRADPDGTGGPCVLLDSLRNEVTLCSIGRGPYGVLLEQVLDRVHQPVPPGATMSLRCLTRDRYVEVFIDGRLVFSTIIDPPSGDSTSLLLV